MNENIRDQAWRWHCALAGDDADWDGFTTWLEADPEHREAYDEVALLDSALDGQRDRLATILPAEEAAPVSLTRRRWNIWAGGAVAAALALIVAIPLFQPDAPDAADYRTAAGQTREIALMDGSHITLGPSSHLAVSGGRQEELALEGGAWFDIRHDPERQLVISAGGQRISDIGTRFDVLALEGRVQVAVANGQVSVGPEGSRPVTITAGKRIIISASKDARVEDVTAQDIGSWRSGRLVYSDAPLSLVAADISRYVGRKVVVSSDVANRRFSGVLATGNDGNLVEELGDLMGLEAETQGGAVRLVARHR
ncbi:MAG: FecR domain-containing protein [Sphingobium sp.]